MAPIEIATFYDEGMHRTLWTLIFALLLQLFAGSSWAWTVPNPISAQEATAATHCHESVAHDEASGQTSAQIGAHHCCAVGIGVEVQVQMPALPQAQPVSQLGSWASWRTWPDLPPPI